MSSPIFAMSLDIPSPYLSGYKTSSNRASYRTRNSEVRDQFQDAPVYIRGFPGYSNINQFSMEQSTENTQFDPNTVNFTQYQPSKVNLNLNDFNGRTSDIDDLVDRLQLRDHDSNDLSAFPNKGNNLAKRSSKQSSGVTELSTLFISIFHTQYCQSSKKLRSTPFKDCLKKYFIMYMRNWENLFEFKRCERTLIQDFKKNQHDKLNKDEWNYLSSCINNIKISKSSDDVESNLDLSKNKPFQEFCNTVRSRSLSSSPSNSSFGTDSGSTTLSWLSRSLMIVQSNSHNAITNSPSSVHEEEELKRLYISIYFPNYQEFWNSDTFVLSGSMMKSIETYLEMYPSIDVEVLNYLMIALEKL